MISTSKKHVIIIQSGNSRYELIFQENINDFSLLARLPVNRMNL